jgi:hypothetical protein
VRIGQRYNKTKSQKEAPVPEATSANIDESEKVYVDDF